MPIKTYDAEFALRQKVSEEARKFVNNGGKMNRIATRAGITQTTVSRLVSRETKYPRMHTVISVLEALGWTLELKKTEAVLPVSVRKKPVSRIVGRHLQ